MNITLLGVPFNGDGTPPEVEDPSRTIRESGLTTRLEACGHRVDDLVDLEIPSFDGVRDPVTMVLNQEAWRNITENLSARLQGRLGGPGILLILGGDCSIMTGVVTALKAAKRPCVLLYLDGHADFRWPADSQSGEPADLVLTALTGRIAGLFEGVLPDSPLVPDEDIAVIGFRDRDRIDESGMAIYDRERIRETGVAPIVRDCLNTLGKRADFFWLHFDVDVLDPGIMPCVLFPEHDGLTVEETGEFIGMTLGTGRILGITVACYHPRIDPDLSGARCIIDILAEALPGSLP